ncbi:hypothetical protein Tco_0968871 [Tanacetum coccineum]
MTTLQFADTHNLVLFLTKSAESEGFEKIVDFLNAHTIKYALTANPTIYTSCIEEFWSTVKAKTVNGEVQLQALVDGKKIVVSEASLTLMGYEKLSQKLTFYKAFFSPQWKFLIHTILQCLSAKTTAWNEFSSTMAYAIICLATNQKFNFSMYIFESMVKNSTNEADEAVNKEMDDSLERAATTTTGLDAEQDRGNINKTQSKETPIEPSSLGTSLGGGPRRQETMGDTSARTSLRLHELVELCTNLQQRVLDLENTKTAQAQEIKSLKLRVKKLEKKGGSRTHRLKRLYKGRIYDIDGDKDIYFVNVHRDEDMFGVNDLEGDEIVVESGVADKNVDLSVDEVTLAQALAALKSAKVLEKGDVIKEPNVPVSAASIKVSTIIPTTAATTITAVSSRPRAKGIVFHEQEQEQEQTPTPIAKVEADYQLAQRLHDEEQEQYTDEEKAKFFCEFLDQRRKTEEELESDKSKKQKLDEKVEAEVDDAKEAEELKQCMEIVPDDGDDVTVDATPLSVKIPIMLKNFNREDLEVLWRIVKARFKKTEPVNYMDNFLLLNFKTMFEHHVEDSVRKNQQGLVKVLNWKLFDSYGVHCVTMQTIPYYLLVEKMYPLTKHTLHQMFNNVKLQVDYECEMAYELLRLVKKQLKDRYVPK